MNAPYSIFVAMVILVVLIAGVLVLASVWWSRGGGKW
jgi:hypothetical protein